MWDLSHKALRIDFVQGHGSLKRLACISAPGIKLWSVEAEAIGHHVTSRQYYSTRNNEFSTPPALSQPLCPGFKSHWLIKSTICAHAMPPIGNSILCLLLNLPLFCVFLSISFSMSVCLSLSLFLSGHLLLEEENHPNRNSLPTLLNWSDKELSTDERDIAHYTACKRIVLYCSDAVKR